MVRSTLLSFSSVWRFFGQEFQILRVHKYLHPFRKFLTSFAKNIRTMRLTRFSMLCELLGTDVKSSNFHESLQNPVEQIRTHGKVMNHTFRSCSGFCHRIESTRDSLFARGIVFQNRGECFAPCNRKGFLMQFIFWVRGFRGN